MDLVFELLLLTRAFLGKLEDAVAAMARVPKPTKFAIACSWIALVVYIVMAGYWLGTLNDKGALYLAVLTAGLTAFVAAVRYNADGIALERKRADDRQIKLLEQVRSEIRYLLQSDALCDWDATCRRILADPTCKSILYPDTIVDLDAVMAYIASLKAAIKITRMLLEISWLMNELQEEYFTTAHELMHDRVWLAMLLHVPRINDIFFKFARQEGAYMLGASVLVSPAVIDNAAENASVAIDVPSPDGNSTRRFHAHTAAGGSCAITIQYNSHRHWCGLFARDHSMMLRALNGRSIPAAATSHRQGVEQPLLAAANGPTRIRAV